MPRKAKDEIIEEVSKEVTKKKTPVKKENKASAEKKVVTKKESTKKETAKKTAKTDETKTVKGKKVTGTTKTEKKTDSTITKKGVNAEKKTSATTKKTATKKAKTTATKRKKKTVEDLEKLVDLEGNNVDLENEENEITEKVNIVEYYDLPYRYNQTVVKILAQTPNILFVYWDISDTDRNNFISQYGENFFNNTIPVLLIINKTMNYSYEIQINDFANSWYLHVNDANCEYQVELGRRHKENPNYYYVTTSNNLDMPNNHILLENISNNVLFKNVKTQELVEKPITSITFFKDFAKSKDFYKYFKELLNNELEGDEINFNLPSSHTSSSFK
jgi:uncharacterized protein-like protein